MTPPDAQGQRSDAAPPEQRPAVSFLILAKRADFLRAASAKRQGTTGFLLQARARGDNAIQVRIGYTASKKIGNAVLRNRAKRRLRALVRQVMPTLAQPGWDYVLVARPETTVSRPFADLVSDLTGAMRAVHRSHP
jgi:ribonuclease P protein component